MAEPDAIAELGRLVAASGLVQEHSSGVVMVSGGPDSACAAAGLRESLGAQGVTALHVNYQLRPTADRDEERCRELCAALRIDLHVERPELGPGNLQAAAREARYAAAESLRLRRGGEWVATGHTRTDLAETMIYRLAASPGSRALLAMPARHGAVIRPLLELTRKRVRELALAAKLPFADDPTNEDRRFARNRIRAEVLPVLREIAPAIERNLALTRAELGEEAEALAEIVAEILRRAGADAVAPAVAAAGLAEAPPALRRLALRELASAAAGHDVALGRARAAEIWRLASSPEGGEVDLGGGLRAICEHGLIRFSFERDREPPPASTLPIPGTARLGEWSLSAELREPPPPPAGPEVATLDADALGRSVEVRTWRQGDRIRPLGLGGSKSLQDLFTDAGVPRSLRRSLPVLVAGGEIAWVAGVAIAERFRLRSRSRRAAVIHAHLRSD